MEMTEKIAKIIALGTSNSGKSQEEQEQIAKIGNLAIIVIAASGNFRRAITTRNTKPHYPPHCNLALILFYSVVE